VWAADWHTRTLKELGGRERSFDRELGVEMALDGALNGLSSAFDAAVALLIRAVEHAREVDIDERLPVYRHNWDRCRDMLNSRDIAHDDVWALILRIDEAVEGESWPEPIGWLAQYVAFAIESPIRTAWRGITRSGSEVRASPAFRSMAGVPTPSCIWPRCVTDFMT
jgi:hypothetical protein